MPFKRRKPHSQIPEVNLVPMMDVLMTVLTFFIIISMTMSGQLVLNVDLPSAEAGIDENSGAAIEIFVVGLDKQGQILIENQVVDVSQLAQQLRTYVTENPDGTAILKADRSLPYDQVATVLKTMRDVGGNRVLLGVAD